MGSHLPPQYIVEVDMSGTGLTYNFKDLYLFEFTKRGSFRFLEKLACLDESEASKVYGLVSLEFEKSVGRSLEKLGDGSFLNSSTHPGALELIELLGGFNTLFDLTMKHICHGYINSKLPSLGNPADRDFSEGQFNQTVKRMVRRGFEQSITHKVHARLLQNVPKPGNFTMYVKNSFKIPRWISRNILMWIFR